MFGINLNSRVALMVLIALGLCLMAAFDVSAATMMGGVMIAPVASLAEAVSTEDLSRVAREFKTSHDDVVRANNELKQQLEAKSGEISGELRSEIDKVLTKYNTLSEQLTGLEQLATKAKEIQDRHEKEEKSVGQQFVESEQYKGFKERGFAGSARLSIEQKVVNTVAAGGMIQSYREPGMVELQRREMTIRDLLTVIPVDTNSVDYAKQVSRTNNAAPVAEAATKPYSDYVWGSATAPIRTIAHLAKLTRQALDDARRLQAEVDSEMRYGLDLVEEAQLLNGDGTGQNLNGILPQATAFAAPAGFEWPGNVNKMDVIRVAMLQLAVALYRPDGIVLNDIDWAEMELTKTTDGAYLMRSPNGEQLVRRLWNLPTVATQAIAATNFLVGNFRAGATLYDRMATEVLISTENADDFEKNLATMRAEKRIGLAVKRPGAFVKGDFDTIIAGITP